MNMVGQKFTDAKIVTHGINFDIDKATIRPESMGTLNQIKRILTDNPDLIAQHSTLPRTLKLTKAADSVAKHMMMAVRRHPELAPTVARQTGAALKQASAALGPVTDAKAAAALSAPKPEDDVA